MDDAESGDGEHPVLSTHHPLPFMQLVDLVKPGPTGTVASTAAVATAAHAALVAAVPDIAPAGLLATVAAGKATHRKSISTVMQVSRKACLLSDVVQQAAQTTTLHAELM